MNKLSVKVRNCEIFIKPVVGRNIAVLSRQEYDNVWAEYGKNSNASKISNGDYTIADVWNEHNPEQVPDRKRGKIKTGFLWMMIET